MSEQAFSERDIARFWSYVNTSGDCWKWLLKPNKPGSGYEYGRFAIKRRRWLAHRAAYIIAHGEIPGKLFVLHRCDNPRCVRPDHLFLGTHDDNMADMVAKGRSPKSHAVLFGKDNGKTKILPEEVREIRRRCYPRKKATYQALALEYGVTLCTIRHIIYNQARRNV